MGLHDRISKRRKIVSFQYFSAYLRWFKAKNYMNKQPAPEEVNYWIRKFNDAIDADCEEAEEAWEQEVAALEDENLKRTITDSVFYAFGTPVFLSRVEENPSDQVPQKQG